MRRVVRSSQPIFLCLISSGVALMALGIVPLSIEGSDAACMATPWLLFLGFTLTFSALFTKTYRINQIMKVCVQADYTLCSTRRADPLTFHALFKPATSKECGQIQAADADCY